MPNELRIPQVNEVRIAGRLMMAPMKSDSPNGPVKCRIASDRYWRDKNGEQQKQTTKIWLEFWGKTAEYVLENCAKADPVMIDGELSFFEGTTRDGNKFESITVRVHRLQKLSWHAEPKQQEADSDDVPF